MIINLKSWKVTCFYPRRPTEEPFPNLVDHTWTLGELLKSIYQEDITISQISFYLGIGEELHGDSLYKMMINKERIKPCVLAIRDYSDELKKAETIEVSLDAQTLKLNGSLLETSEKRDRACTAMPHSFRPNQTY